MIKNIALVSVILLLACHPAKGQISELQQEPEELSKNVIYGTLGFFPIWGAININYYKENSFYPAGNIGYRFQKAGGHFVFRTGAGFPETTYLSLGISF